MKRFVAIICALLMLTTMCMACSPAKRIIGTWKGNVGAYGISTAATYVFYENGSGNVSSFTDSISLSFTYTIDDSVLTITTSVLGVNSTDTYSYEFTDADTLVLTDASGSNTFYRQD